MIVHIGRFFFEHGKRFTNQMKYDISYIDSDGKEYFVEVKAGDGHSFFITPGELNYAKENADKHKLIIVYDIDAEKPKCMELPQKFREDSRYRMKAVIEKYEFEF